jgi:HTH-type transcriptional regulator / antitoxin HigA
MKIIKTEADYQNALKRIEALIELDPEKETPEADELELLTLLITMYEDSAYPIEMPDPVEAIRFRMEQEGLKNADMVPYFGSKSKVSEVLNRKRGLSLSMVRALHEGLDIPAEVLISDPNRKIPEDIDGIDWKRFPLGEMIKLGWIEFEGSIQAARENAEELIRPFFQAAGFSRRQNPVFFRKSLRSDKDVDEYALSVWYAEVLIKQKDVSPESAYDRKILTEEFFSELRRLSFLNEGPSLAGEYLKKLGIKLVYVPHLKSTYLDGAAFLNQDRVPIIALTLRYDRVDNFWFTLFHELSHLALHLNATGEYFFDDLKATENLSDPEKEADLFAEEMLIPQEEWKEFYSAYLRENDVKEFAQSLRISPAIVAGRIQKERDDYRVFKKLLGQNQVRTLLQR